MKAILANPQFVLGKSNPGTIFVNIMTEIRGWIIAGIGVYAAVQFILGAMDFMSKEPQKHSQGKDHMIHACLGLTLAFMAGTIMAYLETQSTSWSAGQINQQLALLMDASRPL